METQIYVANPLLVDVEHGSYLQGMETSESAILGKLTVRHGSYLQGMETKG